MARQKCPLCEALIDFRWTEHGNCKYFSCESCSEVEVSLSAEKKLETAPSAWKLQLSNKAHSLGRDSFLSIIVPGVERHEGFAYESLRATVQPKAA